MNQLAVQLREADQICTGAYPFFERAANMRQSAAESARKARKIRKIIAVVAGFVAAEIIGNLFMLMNAPSVFSLVAIALSVLTGVFLYKRIFIPQVESTFDSRMKEAAKEEAKGTRILEANADGLAVIPSDYWYPLATNYLLKVVESGRALDINQALQMFDEYLHRQKVEKANAAIVAQQQAQTEALRGIRKSSAVNAAANVANAAANISRLF